MEKGNKYEVYYKDDTQTRHKTYIFLNKDEDFLFFENIRNKDEEIIPISNIVRIIRCKEDENNKSNFYK